MAARHRAAVLAGAFLLVAAPCAALAANDIQVTSLADDGSGCTLREAVISVNAGMDTGGCVASSWPVYRISFAVRGTIVLDSPIIVEKGVTIEGPAPAAGEPSCLWPTRITIKVTGNTRSLHFDSPANNQTFRLDHVTLAGSTGGKGGGIYLGFKDSLLVEGCVFRNCVAGAGGAIWSVGERLRVGSSVLAGNEATGNYGGGVYHNGATFDLHNSTLSGNRAAGDGAGAYIVGDAEILMSTFSGNRAGGAGGGLYLKSGTFEVIGSILWGNESLGGGPEIGTSLAALAVTYSDVKGAAVWPGAGNILATPRFVSPRAAAAAPTAAGDYHLKHTSPCVDAAKDSPWIIRYDIDGDTRIMLDAGAEDMGSDEAGPLRNDSFNYGAAVPRPWQGRNLAPGDGRVSDVKHSGSSSFRIGGGKGTKSIRQTMNGVTGFAGDSLTVAGWSKADGASSGGGSYGLKVQVYSGNTLLATRRAAFTRTTHGWQYRQSSMITPGAYDRVVVEAVYANQTGSAWFDDLKLYANR